jgi:serine/threonine-protein kinase
MQDSELPRNQVINSNPPAGDKVDVGSTVQLIVSKGQVTVPNVVGQSVEDATKALEDLGLKVTTKDDPAATTPEGTVTAQSIAPNTKISPGTTIELTVSAKPGDPDGTDTTGTDGADVLGTETDGAGAG